MKTFKIIAITLASVAGVAVAVYRWVLPAVDRFLDSGEDMVQRRPSLAVDDPSDR